MVARVALPLMDVDPQGAVLADLIEQGYNLVCLCWLVGPYDEYLLGVKHEKDTFY